jgi:hypothetical protein
MVELLIPKPRNNTEWKPFPKQELFLALPNSIKEGFYGGGAGSAKTETLAIYPIARGWHEHPRFKQLFLRRTFPELKNEVVPRTKQIYPKFGATWNGQDMAWTFPAPDQFGAGLRSNSGAVVFLGHCETEDDVHRYDSMEINLFTPDELTSFTEWIYLYIGYTRTRTSIPELPAIIRAGGMPGNIGHTWVKRRLVDPCKEGGKIIIGKGGNKRIYIHATFRDNPYLDPTYGKSLEALPEAEYQAKLGNWDAYAGAVFDELRDRHYPDEPENALHKIPAFEVPDWWPKLIIGDWGFTAMTYVGFFAISPTGRLYLYKEMHWIKTKIEEWAPLFKDAVDKQGNIKIIAFCKSTGQDRGQEHTIQQQIEDAIGRPIELSDNSSGKRIAGKLLVHEYLRWKPRPVIPESEMPVYDEGYAQWLIRNKGERDFNNYMALFNPPEEETNIPKLQIFENCPLMIQTLQACSYPRPGKDGKPPEDIAEFAGDDPYDTLRYACDKAERYFTEAADEFKALKRQEALIETLKNTNDWTAFYRNMAIIEAKSIPTTVNMYGRRRRH